MAGVSTEQSRNLASFEANLEKLRNESLRLNKGVQTEGDSVRAWNELIKNINDPAVVKQRIAEINTINDRAANIRKQNISILRDNYGSEELDFTPYESQKGATNVAQPKGSSRFTVRPR